MFFCRLWVQNCEGPGDVYIYTYIYMRTIAWKNTSKIINVLLYTLPLLCNMMYIYVYMIVIRIHITDDYHHCYSCYSRTTRFRWCKMDYRYRWKDLATTSRREGQGLSNADGFAGAGLKQADQSEKAAVLVGAMRMIVNNSRYSIHVRM